MLICIAVSYTLPWRPSRRAQAACRSAPAIADGKRGVERTGDDETADVTLLAAVEIPVRVEIVDGRARPGVHERVEVPASKNSVAEAPVW